MKTLGRILASNLLVLLFLLSLGEGLLRYFDYPFTEHFDADENALAQYDPELGWSYRPDSSGQIEIESYRSEVYFDRNGFRIPRPGYRYDPKRPTILFIGGSFTMGHGVTWEQSFVGRVDTMLQPTYQAVNLGVQAYGTDQSLLALKKHLDKFTTKIVVYTFITPHIMRNGNYDRRLLYPEVRYLGTKPLFALNSSGQLILAKKPVTYVNYRYSFLASLIKMRLGGALGMFPPKPEGLTLALIREMKRYCEEKGAYFLVIDWQISEDDYNLKETKLENDIDILNVLDDAPSYWPDMVRPDGHPNSIAHDRVSRLLVNHLRKLDRL